MLRSLEVNGLHNISDSKIRIAFDPELSVLVGKNGVGKTTILNLVNSVCQLRFDILLGIPFRAAKLEFDDALIEVIKPDENHAIVKHANCSKLIQSALKKAKLELPKGADIGSLDQDAPTGMDELKGEIGEIISRYRVVVKRQSRSEGIHWDNFKLDQTALYFPTYRRLELDLGSLRDEIDIEDIYISRLRPLLRRFDESSGIITGSTGENIERIIRVQWIRTIDREKQRLNEVIFDFMKGFLDAPENFPDITDDGLINLEKSLSEGLRKTGVLSDGDEQKVRDYMDRLRRFSEREKVDMVDDFPLVHAMLLSPTISQFQAIWKQAQLDIQNYHRPFIRLRDLLSQFLNKEVVFGEESRHVAFKTGGRLLTFDELSAGEKQLVTLFVFVALSVKRNKIILIDEPELSLHVTWQRKLLASLQELNSGCQFIAATHSPFIFGSHNDAVVSLGEWDE